MNRDVSTSSEALVIFQRAVAAEKCWSCGCFHNLLRALSKGFADKSFSPELSEALNQAQKCLTEAKYDCLGCEVCFPPLVLEALSRETGADLLDLDICPAEVVKERQGWPPLAGLYTVRRFGAPVAICTLMDDSLKSSIAQVAGLEVAIVGTLATENLGIERVIHNVLANPNIRFLILCGVDSQRTVGHWPGQSFLALAEKGLDDRGRILGAQGRRPVVKNITKTAVEHFRRTVEVVDLIGQTDLPKIITMAQACAARNPGPAPAFHQAQVIAPIPGHLPSRMAPDPAGYFVVYADRSRGVLSLEHYSTDGVLDAVIEGRAAAELYTPVIERGLLSRLDHAAYLGRELARAEESLRSGEPYIQDAAPELAAPLPLASGACGPACHEAVV